MTSAKLLLLGSAAWAAATITGAPARAQDAAPQAAIQLEDIIVTARRTEERLQDTPVAVTALGETAILQAQIVDSAGIQRVAPSLSVATGSSGGSNFAYVSIRGSGSQNPGVGNDPAVGTYIDGVYIPRPSQSTTDLVDVARVEVLRGPQGTLFGRNTTGGALNIVTADPSAQLEGLVRLEAGNYDYKNAQAVLNVPLAGDALALRLVYDGKSREGYVRDASLGDRDLNGRESQYFRGKLLWEPSDAWSVLLEGDYNRVRDNGNANFLAGVLPTANPLIGAAGDLSRYLHQSGSWYTAYNNPFVNNFSQFGAFRGESVPYDRLEAYGGSLTIEGEIGPVAVKSITAYRYSLSQSLSDLDATPVQILAAESFYRSRQISQELQFSGDLTERLSYIFGGYVSREKGGEGSLSQTFGFLQPGPNFGYALNLADVLNESAGVFGQAYYDVTDSIRLSAGLRWTWDRREATLHNRVSLAPSVCAPELTPLPGFVAPCSFPRGEDFNYPAWTVGLDWRVTEDWLAYVKSSHAAKAGGFNLRNGSALTPPFDPEKVTDVEVGTKFETADGRLRANAALFYIRQTGVQRNAADFINGQSTQYLLNAGDQNINGGEFELTVLPWEGMTLGANLSLMQGEYRKGSFTEQRDLPIANLAGCRPTPTAPATSSRCVIDRSGETVPQLPEQQFNLSATQRLPTSLGEVTLHANYAYIGEQTFETTTADPRESAARQAVIARQNALGKVDGYGLLDARVSLQLKDVDVELYAFGRNITGEKYTSYTFGSIYSSLGVAVRYVGAPTMWGVGAVYRFGS